MGIMMKALIICSEQAESNILSAILKQANLQILPSRNLQTAFEKWEEYLPDIIILGEYDPSDLEGLAQLRSETIVPIILLTERHSESELLSALENGVDLIISKPYNPRLFGHQIERLARRFNGIPLNTLPQFKFSDLSLDPNSRMIRLGDEKTHRLSHLEFRLLYTLINNAGRVLTADELVEKVWGYTGEGDSELVRKLVWRVRGKVEADPSNPKIILTIPSLGYKFNT